MLQGNQYQEHKGSWDQGNQSYQGDREGRPYPIRKTANRRMVRATLAVALGSFPLLPFALIPVAPMGKTTARRMVRAPLAGALVALLALLPIVLVPIAQDPIPSTWRLACPRAMHPSHS